MAASIDEALAALSRYQTAIQKMDPTYTVDQGWFSPLNKMSGRQQVIHVANQLQKNKQWADMRGYSPPAAPRTSNNFQPRPITNAPPGGNQPVAGTPLQIARNQEARLGKMPPLRNPAGGLENKPDTQAMKDARSMISQLQKTAPAGQYGAQIGNLYGSQVKTNFGKDQEPGGKQLNLGEHPIRALIGQARMKDPVLQQFLSDISPEHQAAVTWNTEVVPAVNDQAQQLIDWATRRDAYDHASSKARTAMGGAPSYRGLEKWVTGPMSVANVLANAQWMTTPEGQQATAMKIYTEQAKERGTQANQLNALQATAYDPATGQPITPPADMTQFQQMMWLIQHGGMIGYNPPAAAAAAPQSPLDFEANVKAARQK